MNTRSKSNLKSTLGRAKWRQQAWALVIRRRWAALGLLAAVLLGLLLTLCSGPVIDRTETIQGSRWPQAPDAAALKHARPTLAVRERQAIDRAIAQSGFFRQGQPRKREVALTFDDGPGPYTPEVLRTLHRFHTPATFFEVGFMLTYFHQSVRPELRSGDAIGDHTQTHPRMGALSATQQAQEMTQQQGQLRRYGGQPEQLFRPPYGSFDATTLKILRRMHMLMVLWSVDTKDYATPGSAAIAHAALQGARPGAIILMHDAGGNRSETAAALPQIIRGLRRRHLKPVTIPRLVLDDPPPVNQIPPSGLGGY